MCLIHRSISISPGPLRPDCPFYQYLQNRLSEFNKEGKDWKFGLILSVHKTIQRLSSAGVVLGTPGEVEVTTAVLRMVEQGAYYMPPRMEEPQMMDG